MKNFPLVLTALLVSLASFAQEKKKSITLSDSIISSAIDRPGDFYVLTKEGQIQRFDKDGKLMLLYKAAQVPTLFDPRDGARLFTYYRDDQHYEFMNPSFEATVSYKIDASFAIQPWLICPSGEHKLWILDKEDNSLKKINIRDSEVELEVVVDSALIRTAEVFTSMREYQNFVFLLDKRGSILIFNAIGQHIRTLQVPGIRSFNFLGEELYYRTGNTLEFFNLFTAERRQMNIPSGYTDALLTDERMILLTPVRIDIFGFRP